MGPEHILEGSGCVHYPLTVGISHVSDDENCFHASIISEGNRNQCRGRGVISCNRMRNWAEGSAVYSMILGGWL